jgi:hypothetical protein
MVNNEWMNVTCGKGLEISYEKVLLNYLMRIYPKIKNELRIVNVVIFVDIKE